MDKNLIHAFGKALKALRNDRGLSQEDLAFKADLDRTYISMLERGIRQPTLTTIFQLSKVLGVSASGLLKNIEHTRPVFGAAESQTHRKFAPKRR